MDLGVYTFVPNGETKKPHSPPTDRKSGKLIMIQNDQELEATLARIRHFQKQVEKLREVETNPRNYKLSAGGFLSEIDRMNLEMAEYLSIHSSELIKLIADTDRIKTDGMLFHFSTWYGWRSSMASRGLVTE